ncbi:MAG TPA: hypothetical protein VGB44_00845 [Flavobacterium sp.]
MRKTIIFTFLILTAISCEKTITTAEPSRTQLLAPGEWKSSSDSLSGLSIRKDRMAFYINNKFNAEGIAQYSFVDSIEITGDKKFIKGTYLIAKGIDDKITYRIEDQNLYNISVEFKNGKIEKYSLTKKNGS